MNNLMLRITAAAALLLFVSVTAVSQMRSNKFGVGLSGSYFLLQSDFTTAKPSLGGGIDLSYSVAEYFSIRSSMGFGLLEAKTLTVSGVTVATSMQTGLVFGNLYLTADLSPNGIFNPFIFVGGSGVYIDPRANVSGVSGSNLTNISVGKRIKGTVVGGVGFDLFANEFLSFTLSGEIGLPYSDVIDGYVGGTKKDSYQRISLGIRYYFFDQDFITRMLKALEERYK